MQAFRRLLTAPILPGPIRATAAERVARIGRPTIVMTEIGAWTLAAEVVLRFTRLCHRAGLLSQDGVGAGLRWSLWLTHRAVHTWCQTPPRGSGWLCGQPDRGRISLGGD